MSVGHRTAAWLDLLRRYRRTFSYFWSRRTEQDGAGFSAQEAEFLPAALSLQEAPVSATARLTGWTLMALVAGALLWAVLGKIDIVVNASGKIIPSGHTKVIASPEVAVVRAVHVEEGQAVRAGDVLIELDTSAADAEHDKAKGDEAAATLQVARAHALITAIDRRALPELPATDGVSEERRQAARQQLESQFQDFRSRLARLEAEISRFSQALPLATRTARDYQALALEHDVSEHAWIEKEQARIEVAGQLADARHQRDALVAQTRKEAQEALTEGRRLADANHQDARRAGQHSQMLRLTAPVDGTVQQLGVHTVGGVAPAAQALMSIVPRETRVEVEAYLENKDVGFVREGQEAAVKIDAFEYSKYGTVPARVTHVSRDAVQDDKKGLVYAVRITMDRPGIDVDGMALPLSAGMSVNAEVKTGTRRVIDYVLSPLVQHRREALHER